MTGHEYFDDNTMPVRLLPYPHESQGIQNIAFPTRTIKQWYPEVQRRKNNQRRIKKREGKTRDTEKSCEFERAVLFIPSGVIHKGIVRQNQEQR
tara:strand:+ start:407 stop:688 length:282 start_codon:yes stop_codon:yes gene_type:complete